MTSAPLLDAVVALARRAGAAILEVYAQDFTVTKKADDSPVTAADLAAHRIILEGLAALTPGLPVVSEEGDIEPADVRAAYTRWWLVDPLDGTREFLARNGQFTVNIALIENERPVLGVVFAPVLDALYAAQVGGGAWREIAGERERLRTRALPATPLLMLSRAHPDPDASRRLHGLAPFDTTSLGSSLKYCRIAEGGADAYPKFASISLWDTAAGQCVLEQAGGVTLSLGDFQPMRYAPGGSLRTTPFIAAGDAAADWAALLRA